MWSAAHMHLGRDRRPTVSLHVDASVMTPESVLTARRL
jgi:hypothetical protein